MDAELNAHLLSQNARLKDENVLFHNLVRRLLDSDDIGEEAQKLIKETVDKVNALGPMP